LFTIIHLIIVMATIVEQGKLIIQHPFFAECLEKANNGDMSGFERLFYEVQSHCWERCSLQSARTYGIWHRGNHMTVKKELRDMPPPTNLDLRLPFVQPKQESRPQVFKLSRKTIRTQVNNPNQLCFNFEGVIRHLKIA
jgi:hypothetical protein